MRSSLIFVSMLSLLSSASFAQTAVSPGIKTPSISANTLFLYRNSNFHQADLDPAAPDQERNGFNLQEAELQFYADVDPYSRVNVVLAVHPELESDGTTVEEKWVVEPEEAFAESIAIPSLTLKIGKFKAAFGKHNLLHTHAFPFVDAPLANKALLGDEGLNDAGVSAAWLTPLSWYSELTLQVLRGQGENEQFKSPRTGDNVGLAHWKNLWDLSDDLTVEVGASYAQGGNSFRETTSMAGGDLTFKWRPSANGRSASLIWGTESLQRVREQAGVDNERASGWSSFVQYQFAERWAGLYRYDTLNVKDSFDPTALANDDYFRHSVGVVHNMTEFSSLKLEYNSRRGGPANANGDDEEKSIFLQASFTIGSHPSHSY
ncbi:MAG: hypothetical protein KF681_13410 [Bdellovibrionaceae bacterium]|nr:hypothetical protein [Pseudobdellovibrionaceae bacterium]